MNLPANPTHHRRRRARAFICALALGSASALTHAQGLSLVEESKLATLLGDASPDQRLEASGVAAHEDRFFVVFDNLDVVVALPRGGWSSPPVEADVLTEAVEAEGIVHDQHGDRWFLVEEVLEREEDDEHPELNARIREYSAEVDDGDAGDISRIPGNGRVKIFTRPSDGDGWEYVASLDLPRSLPFADFSGIDLRGDLLAVVSQESSGLWIESIEQRREGESERWLVDEGRAFTFPPNAQGRTVYCNVEGVSWIDERKVVVVSDRTKDDQDPVCREKDQSIHIFTLPDGA